MRSCPGDHSLAQCSRRRFRPRCSSGAGRAVGAPSGGRPPPAGFPGGHDPGEAAGVARRHARGSRHSGAWLAALNPAWNGSVLRERGSFSRRHGTPAARCRGWRPCGPFATRRRRGRAASFLAGDEPRPNRRTDLARFLAVLVSGLGPRRPRFPSKAVSREAQGGAGVAAASLLARLPGSARGERNIVRLAPLLSVDAAAKGFLSRGSPAITVTLPETATIRRRSRRSPATESDTQKKRGAMGYKAVMLSRS